jgi:hypothetical protein
MVKEKYQECIDACQACAAACDYCAVECLEEADVQMMTECIRLDLYCADICRTAATFMARGDEYAKEICELCATICDDCAIECRKHEMEHCQACADACEQCAEECRKMAS